MATYGGVDIFGDDLVMNVVDLPRREQKDTYFGVEGTERKDGGFTGRVAVVQGVLTGTGTSGLSAAEELMRSYIDGVPRILVDTLGRSWPGMKLVEFQPGGIAWPDGAGGMNRNYSARFTTG